MVSPAIELTDFSLGYPTSGGTRLILERTSATVPAGGFWLLIGPSGGGKSSLLTALLSLDDPYAPSLFRSGQLQVLGVPVGAGQPRALRRRVGAVFQDGALIDELSPRQNVALAVRENPLPGQATGERVQQLLDRVQLSHPPTSVAALSGGQRKRVALARALATQPELVILDEPTAGLDPRGAAEIAHLLRQVHDESDHRTTLIITHDLAAFLELADGALMIDARRGKLSLVDDGALPDAIARSQEEETLATAPPAVDPLPAKSQVFRWLSKSSLFFAALPRLVGCAIRHLPPYHLRASMRSISELVISPALYLVIAAAVAGGLTTNFALANNPLEGAFRREVLIGSGKVLVSAAIPLLVGVLLAARTAAGATARLGGLKKSRVFEALPLLGISTEAFLLTPLLLASIIATLVHTALGIVSGCLASLLAAKVALGVTPFSWASASFLAVEGSDFKWAAGKAVVSAISTALICYFMASRPKRSAQEVARATSDALVASTLAVLLIHGGLTLLQFGN